MEPHGLKPVIPGLPRFAPRNRTAISGVKSRKFLFEKFLGIRYGKILFPERFEESPGLNPQNRKAISGDDNFAILAGVIRRRITRGFALRRTSRRSKSFFAFIHGLKSRGILRRRIRQDFASPPAGLRTF
ncbi:MAG: hypothetical protein A2705_01880 [Omnitrophica WOR_2 bacterium RIFCSPHIGHO2_01_FULL_52_10]|nr:MAG: hypothetical protein A2705_01880 [Omnitrophica WOR_2 bacterium RIFCSPHIGHO2_01_FULL_52_10]